MSWNWIRSVSYTHLDVYKRQYLCQQYETYREDLDEIVELIVETVCAKRKTTRIAGSDFPHEIVRSDVYKRQEVMIWRQEE